MSQENVDNLRALWAAWTPGHQMYTGIEEEGPLAYVWTFRDGKVIHFHSYRDPDEALAPLDGD